MSSAYYPQGMRAMPASGYNHKSTFDNKQYIPWKGVGILSNPVGVAPGHIRPLTNNDPGNVFLSGSFPSRTFVHTRRFIPRPLKHYRKGRTVPSALRTDIPNLIGADPHNQNILLDLNEQGLINYNMHRQVKSSLGTSLGGGFGGSGLLNEMQDKPGAFVVKQNEPGTTNENTIDSTCTTCEGVGIVSSYYPNNTYITENPNKDTTNPLLCCNEEYKARRRVLYANTNLSKKYYTTTKQYLQNRCKTYDQKAFNFLANRDAQTGIPYSLDEGRYAAKPGSPLATFHTYLANCQPNAQIFDAAENSLIAQMYGVMVSRGLLTEEQQAAYALLPIYTIREYFDWLISLPEPTQAEGLAIFRLYINRSPLTGPSNPNGCQLAVYKPNNYQFAQQGAVSSSTRLLKLNVNTISTNAASIQNYNNMGAQLVTANELYVGNNPNYTNLLKNKAPGCNNPTPYPFQNKKACYYSKQMPSYQVPASQPSPYRYFPGTIFSSNHFAQSPNTYLSTGGSAAYKTKA